MSKKWQKKRLKFCDTLIMGQSPDGTSVNTDGYGIPFMQGNSEFGELYPSAKLATTEPAKFCSANDVLISVRAPVGAVNLADKKYAIGRGLCAIHPCQHDSKFLFYLCKIQAEQLNSLATGTTFTAVSTQQVGNLVFYLPTLPEQRGIAAYLDDQTAKIDRLINLRQRQMALLKEQRAALIQQAVTRGLNPNAPMKESGLPWLGEIPAHWEIKRLKWLATLQRGYDLPDQNRVEGDIPVVTSGGIVANHNQAMVKAPGVVTGRYGSTGNVFYIDSDFWPHNTALYVNDFHNNIPRFVYYVMQTINYEIHSVKSAVPGVDRKDLHETFVVVPPRSEQEEIVIFIESKNEKFNALNSAYIRQLTLLTEYRAALIHECVTGRRVVPDYFNTGG